MNTLELWAGLHKVALLGTGRAGEMLALPEGAPDSARVALESDREGALLSLLAAASLQRRAGVLAPALEAADVEKSVCPDESRPVAPPAACNRLRALGSNEVPLLLEWLELARSHQVLAPHDLLPALLLLGSRSKAARPAVAAVLGERGRWLSALNPEWKWARGEALDQEAGADECENLFLHGEGEARAGAFARLRSLDAARGLQVLEAAWNREPADKRRQWIEMLQPQTSEQDEPFLERALDDRSEAVRQMAAQVLVALPGSAFARRAIERCDKYLRASRLDGALKIEADLPTSWDKPWARDGIEEEALYADGTVVPGHRMRWLVEMVAATPPTHWEERWSATPTEVVEAVVRDEIAVLKGLALAALHSRDSRWMMAILTLPRGVLERGVPAFFLGQAPRKVEPAQRDSLLCERVRQIEQSLNGIDMANLSTELAGHAHPWSRALTLAVLSLMRALGRRAIDEGQPSNASQSEFLGTYFLWQAPRLAPLMHLGALATLDEGWPSSAPDFFETARLGLREIYEVRRAMRREFES